MSTSELSDDVGAEIADPRPAALIETFRAIGYNLPTAIADIIDNSISAGATDIRVTFHWDEANSYVKISDNGCGMNLDELINALRPGTADPLSDRPVSDLGRFGLGLKTASFSQCRRLSVITKTKAMKEAIWRGWDLDYVAKNNRWQIVKYLSDPGIAADLNRTESGTVIFWEKLDRIVFDQNKKLTTKQKFWESAREAERHLSLVFHRFLEKKKLMISVNNNAVQPWNPFLTEEPATQFCPEENYDNGLITVKGFVLPHASKMTAEKLKAAAGPEGWAAQQGFYIYRKDRVILAGDWLGLFRKDEFTRLARIMVEIDSSMDFSWQLDIRKSRALPPKMFLDKLKRYAAEVRKNAVEVYRYRGKQQQRKAGRSSFEFVWVTTEENGRDVFKINRKHPLYRIIKDKLRNDKKDLERLTTLLEMTLPLQAIAFSENQQSENPVIQQRDDQAVFEMMKSAYHKLLKDGLSAVKAVEELYFIDPFSNYPHLVIQLTDDEKN